MLPIIFILTSFFLGYLYHESWQADRDRRALAHIVHVNGIRGKSTVSRLIAAGLSADGISTYCKTTGTDPAVIGPDGREMPIRRRGPANIREQLSTLHAAARSGARVLVVECMAVSPELQSVSQDQMLCADIGVITNVRYDHTDLMGDTLPEIADSLSATIPAGGILFTAEPELTARLSRRAAERNCRFAAVSPRGDEPDFDFPENIALALAVCEHLGADRETALSGMAGFHRDPFALSLYQIGGNLFVNALSANDPQSTLRIWQRVEAHFGGDYPSRILILNNRADRPARIRDMLSLIYHLSLDRVYLLGAGQPWLRRRLAEEYPRLPVTGFRRGELPDLVSPDSHTLFFAAGNLAGEGRRLLEKVGKEGTLLV